MRRERWSDALSDVKAGCPSVPLVAVEELRLGDLAEEVTMAGPTGCDNNRLQTRSTETGGKIFYYCTGLGAVGIDGQDISGYLHSKGHPGLYGGPYVYPPSTFVVGTDQHGVAVGAHDC